MQKNETAVFGGGCFWCTEAIFKNLRGVLSVMPGYAGGKKDNPTWFDVSEGTTGHAEVVNIEFDPKIIPYEVLLDVFFHTHDPTSLNQQGADRGTEYRSVIFYTNPEQKIECENMIKNLNASGTYTKPIVTEIQPLEKFSKAEDYHIDYYNKNSFQPYCQVVISPKLKHLREKYSKLLT